MYNVKSSYRVSITKLNPVLFEELLNSICEKSGFCFYGHDDNLLIKLNRRITKVLGLDSLDMPQISYRMNDRRDGIEIIYENLKLEKMNGEKFRDIVKSQIERLAKELNLEPYIQEIDTATIAIEKTTPSKT